MNLTRKLSTLTLAVSAILCSLGAQAGSRLPAAEEAGFLESRQQLAEDIVRQGSGALRSIRFDLVRRIDQQAPPELPAPETLEAGESALARGCDGSAGAETRVC